MVTSLLKHPLRTLTLLAVAAGVVIAVKNSIADKGGSYTPPATPHRPSDVHSDANADDIAMPTVGPFGVR